MMDFQGTHHIALQLHARRLITQLQNDGASVRRASTIADVGRLRPPTVPAYLRALVRTTTYERARTERVMALVDERARQVAQLAEEQQYAQAEQVLRALRADVHTWCRGDLAAAWPHAQATLRRLEPLRGVLAARIVPTMGAAAETARPRG